MGGPLERAVVSGQDSRGQIHDAVAQAALTNVALRCALGQTFDHRFNASQGRFECVPLAAPETRSPTGRRSDYRLCQGNSRSASRLRLRHSAVHPSICRERSGESDMSADISQEHPVWRIRGGPRDETRGSPSIQLRATMPGIALAEPELASHSDAAAFFTNSPFLVSRENAQTWYAFEVAVVSN
jgi:hypothetical protein